MKTKSIITLNGEIPSIRWYKVFSNHFHIVADGALAKVSKLKVPVDLVVGDFDSAPLSIQNAEYEYLLLRDQNATDGEKCIEAADARSLLPSIICGVNGSEYDHSIFHTFLLCRRNYHRVLSFCIDQGVRQQVCFVLTETLNFNVPIGSIISLIPVPKATLSTQGLQWELIERTLQFGKNGSLRNRAIKPNIDIEVTSGKVLVTVMSRDFDWINPLLDKIYI